MKKNILLLLTLLVVPAACSPKAESTHPAWSYDAVVYELNMRQYTPEGTFAAAQKELPRLKELGVDVLWLMPVYPIGVKERKGVLGSYYAISDYCDINPEYGKMADFDSYLAEAHKEGFKVILDWVANHTSPDAKWINEKPLDWYERDSLGNTIVQYDWTDIAALNYDNEDMRHEMRQAMRFWLDKGIDGFRCDMACEVPMDFWKSTIDSLRSEYGHIYMLAEGEDTRLHDAGFDASYSWELHHMLNDIARGKANADSLRNYIRRNEAKFGTDAFRLMFTSNHDENSWAGTEFERMGDAVKCMAVLTYTLPQGQPLIYTGQEIGFDRRFKFFEKDNITDWTANEYTAFYKDLNALRHRHPALEPGNGGATEYLDASSDGNDCDDKVLAFRRSKDKDNVTVIANLTSGSIAVNVPGAFEGILTPWEYIIKEN